MKIYLTIAILFSLFSTRLFSQGQIIAFDTISSDEYTGHTSYYSKTDFSIIDSIELWNYYLDKADTIQSGKPVKSFGVLHFWRTRTIDDKISNSLYGHYWSPDISFRVFSNEDSLYCYKISGRTRGLSSCVPPDVGGDIIRIGKFILVSIGVCLNCQRYDTKVDYCRPVINYIFSKINQTKVVTLEGMVGQFPINQGQYRDH